MLALAAALSCLFASRGDGVRLDRQHRSLARCSAARSAAAALASKRLHRQSSGERPRRPARERLAVLHRAMSVAMRPLRRLACLAYGASHKASC